MENEIPSVNRVDDIRDQLKGLEGKRLKVRANMGRSRIVERPHRAPVLPVRRRADRHGRAL